MRSPGLEIGPSYHPVAPKSKGFNVQIIDHADKHTLIEKYTMHGVDCSHIEDVDYIWRGEPYAELTGRRNYYSWIIASHIIEHTPDLVAFLLQCEEILDPSGCLSLAVPDHRYCFDRFRSPTNLAEVIDAHESQRLKHSVGTAADFYLNAVSMNGSISWSADAAQSCSFALVHTPEDAKEAMRRIRSQEAYMDLHAWRFTPNSFRLLLRDLYELGVIRLRERHYFPTQGCEFFVTLSKAGTGPSIDRLALAELAYQERKEPEPAFAVRLSP